MRRDVDFLLRLRRRLSDGTIVNMMYVDIAVIVGFFVYLFWVR